MASRVTAPCIIMISVFLSTAAQRAPERLTPKQCQEITVPMCKGIGYNMTYTPNQFNHDNQEEAGLKIQQFWPLVDVQCSPDLQFFLCSIYTPICVTNYPKPLPACRSVCKRARSGCAPLMQQYGFAWPERMRCEDLPEFGDKGNLCMDFNTSVAANPVRQTQQTVQPSSAASAGQDEADTPKLVFPKNEKILVNGLTSKQNDGKLSSVSACACSCNSPLYRITNESLRYYNRIVTGGINNCAINCEGPYFSAAERQFSTFWIGTWSSLCSIFTLLTVITFLINSKRFEYPERPIIFLSGCYLMVSLGYIVSLAVGHEVACDGAIVRYESNGSAVCIIVFLLVYYFGMASSIWWVVLSLTWFLAAGAKWSQEAISSYSHYFHLVAWIVPSIKSVTVLALSGVDGDPVSGICYVGNHGTSKLTLFVLTPLFIYLIVGTIFLVGGFISLFRIREVIKGQGHHKTVTLEKLMIRIVVFFILYTVPAAVVIGCHLYELHYREVWVAQLTCPCSSNTWSIVRKPSFSVFMLKYFMCLVVGITSGFWVWSSKTLQAWCNACGYLCCLSIEARTKIDIDRDKRTISNALPLTAGLPCHQVAGTICHPVAGSVCTSGNPLPRNGNGLPLSDNGFPLSVCVAPPPSVLSFRSDHPKSMKSFSFGLGHV